ncbi:MAG: cell division protein ZapA [Gemmatimonadaceae bacterium]|nr:cell division protein ZapA [Gemmatimonadaceae bacterium]
MSGPKHSTRVTIGGEEYTIRSDAAPERTKALAEHVDKAVRDVTGNASVVESHKAAILAAFAIADELFREREEREAVAGSMRSLAAELRRWLPPGKRGPTA